MSMISTENTVVHLLEESRDPSLTTSERLCLLMEAFCYAVMGVAPVTKEDMVDAGYKVDP